MSETIRKLMAKYREIILYGIFGVLTTIVNYAAYIAWIAAFPGKSANMSGTAVSWIISVLFAYFTNRRFVFESKAAGFAPLLQECLAFFSSRLFSGVVDLAIMYFAVDVAGFEGKIVKLLSNVIVIILNYVLSKFLVFKKN